VVTVDAGLTMGNRLGTPGHRRKWGCMGKHDAYRRPVALVAALAIALGAATALTATTARTAAADPPAGFNDTTVFSGHHEPTTVQFAPDGKVFVTEKSGLVWRHDSINDPVQHLVADLRTQVYNFWDKGLVGLAIDPHWGPSRPYLYVQYSFDHALGDPDPGPRWGTPGASNDSCPTPPGATQDGCVVSGRISKLVLDGTAGGAVSEQVLVEDWCSQFPSHSVGTIAFAGDGTLYAGGGDGADFNSVDYGQAGGSPGSSVPANPCGDPPGGIGTILSAPSAQGGSLRSQAERLKAHESTTGKVTLDGTIIRIDPDTGAGVAGNPLFSTPGADANERRMVAFGLRNPFRFGFKAGTNDLWIGDVGWDTTEEIDHLPVFSGLPNYGWPCYEGFDRQSGYEAAGLSACTDLYNAGAAAVRPPHFTYSHLDEVVQGDGCGTGPSAVTGVTYYNTTPGTPFPAQYNGALFFTDYVRNCIWVMHPGANGQPDPGNVDLFDHLGSGAVDLVESNTGALWYVNIDSGEIHRISFTGGANSPPVARFTSTPASGPAPLTVSFDASSSTDPDGDALTYAWDLNGDGVYGDDTGVTSSMTYAAGSHVVRLQVTDSNGASSTVAHTVVSGTSAPIATILTPSPTLTWRVGQAINFSGSAVNSQGAGLPASSLSWLIRLLTCDDAGANCVQRSSQPFNGVASGSMPAPDWSGEGNTLLEIRLTATNGGLSDVDTVRLNPRMVTLTFQTLPPGLTVAVASNAAPTPFTRTVIVNSTTSVGGPSPQGAAAYQWAAWSDGGAQSHLISAPTTDTTYTALYVTATRYVQQLYLDLLGRPVDAAGATYWTQLINAGGSRATAAFAIVSGHEYHAKMIEGVFQQVLHRGIDAQGVAYWSGLLDTGASVENLTAFIMGSDEYYARAGGTPNGFINAAFADVLGRAPDPGGRAYFLSLLQQGVPRGAAAGVVTLSAEGIGRRVNSYYQALLGRGADRDGLAYWVGAIAHGHHDQEVVALIVSSGEYLGRL
jgi:PKD repeat protein